MPVKKTGKIYAKDSAGAYYQIMPEEPDYQGATTSSAGKPGFVPAAQPADKDKFLKGDASWGVVEADSVQLTGYAPASSAGEVTSSDTVITALGKLETGLDTHTHSSVPHASNADQLGGVVASSYALKADLVSVYEYKGSVTSSGALPSSGMQTGDVYDVQDTGMNYAWNGSAWDALGQLVDVSALVPTSRTVNGHALSGNITLSAADVGAASSWHMHPAQVDIVSAYPTSSSVADLANGALLFYIEGYQAE